MYLLYFHKYIYFGEEISSELLMPPSSRDPLKIGFFVGCLHSPFSKWELMYFETLFPFKKIVDSKNAQE